MFGFWKRRRLAREQAAEAQRKKLRDQAVQTDRLERIAARQSGVQASSGHSAPILMQHDPLHPLSPLSPLNMASSIDYASPEPVRDTCSPVVSDDSWNRSRDSAYSCSTPTYEPSPSNYEPASY